jgi:hypothetical protein
MDNSFFPETRDSDWKTLYRIGAYAILIAVIFFRRYYGVELITFKGFGIFDVPEVAPVSALDWFGLLQDNPYVGLSILGLYDLVNYALVGLFFLALCVALWQVNRGGVLIATASSLLGTGVYLASNQAFSMLALSQKFAAATTEVQRTTYLASGEALLAVHDGTGSYASLLLVLMAGLIVSIIMLRSGVFGKATAVMGLLANGFGLVYFPVLIFAPVWIWLPPSFSAPFRVIWYVMAAIKLLRLAKSQE